MDKKYQQPFSSKGTSTEFKKSQDNNAKQFPKTPRRTNHFTKNDQPRKSNAQKTKTFGKIPKPKGQYYGCSKEESKVAVPESELGSVMAKGSKKQNKNGNHLLDLSFPPRDSQRGGGGYNGHRRFSLSARQRKYDKDQFLQANCQFVVTANGDYTNYLINEGYNADKLIDWEVIQQIIVKSSEIVSCPICLYPPVAGKITRCGHIYCWPCILKYLSVSEENGPKCPVCFFSVYKSGLKSVKIIINQNKLNVGDTITFHLMRREKKSLIAMPVGDIPAPMQFLSVSDKFCQEAHSKLLLAKSKDIEDIINLEKKELQNELAIEKNLHPDSHAIPFIEQALMELESREKLLDTINENEKKLSQFSINGTNDLEDQESACGNSESIYTGEENDLLNNLCNKNKTSRNQGILSESQKFYYFYQAETGQNVYLYTLNVKMLEEQYGSLEKSPLTISGTLLEREVDSLTEDTRGRMRYLGHLPVTSQIEFIEIDLHSFVSKQVLQMFSEQLNYRQAQRERNERKELKREKKIAEKENKLMGRYPPPEVYIDSHEHFPQFQPEPEFNEVSYNLSSPIESPVSSVSSSPAINSTFEELVSVAGKEKSSWSSPSSQTQSFAQMLQSNKSFAWPSLKSSAKKAETKFPPLPVQPAIGIEPEMEEYTPPMYNPSLGDALAQALENRELLNKEGAKNDNVAGKKKKKKPKAAVLFATNMARAS